MAIKTVFFGSPEFALPSLAALADDPAFEVLAVLTNPDRPAGRGMDLRPTPVKAYAVERGIPVYETTDLSEESCVEVYPVLRQADVNVVVATSHFVPKWLRELPPFGSVNLHPSLLPRWRGAAPIQHAVMAGDRVTGVAIIRIVKEVDAGPVLAQTEEPIGDDDTYGSLAERLSTMGAALLVETIKGLEKGTVAPREQVGEVTYAPKLTADDRRVDWARPAEELERQVRGLYPKPGAFFEFGDTKIQVLKAVVDGDVFTSEPGRVAGITDAEVIVECGVGHLTLVTVKPAGKGEMSAGAFARGRHVEVGSRFK
ncbi:MAG: methionyl-tRNA formyltransferase [Candidatus Coatesbacteria bacterium]|nr:MAG: methionyl-tRNA formyltransferase [Candidatus Coatesbacteria bacterium]